MTLLIIWAVFLIGWPVYFSRSSLDSYPANFWVFVVSWLGLSFVTALS